MPANDPYGLLQSGLPPDMAAQARGLTRKQAIAEALMAQSRGPLETNRMAGGYVVPISPFEGIAKVAQAYLGRKGVEAADREFADLGARYNDTMAKEIETYKRTKEGMPEVYGGSQGGPDADLSGMDSTYTPAVPGNPQAAVMQAMLSRNPQLQRIGQMDAQTMQQDKARKDQQEFQAREAEENRKARMAERALMLEARAAEAALSREAREAAAAEAAQLRRELAGQSDATQRAIAAAADATRREAIIQNAGLRRDAMAIADAQRQQKNTPKLPTSALKLQQEELDAIGTASAINADLSALEKQIAEGKLNPSLVGNLMASARNTVGMSNEESRNLASFKSTLEKMRNDSLRLNKGVQTEGDAQRAWNELISNINDKGVVQQRLAEIKKINERAVLLRKNNVDVIRSNFGLDAMDTAPLTNQPAAVGGGASGGWSVVR